jgi:hypothetical protein
VQLTSQIFQVSDANRDGALDVRDLLGNIIFWLKGDLSYKFALFFNIYSSYNDYKFVSKGDLVKPIAGSLKILKETFFLAKTACDKMNTSLNGRISFDEFRQFCLYNPSAIDFICRLTIGPYSPSTEL